MSNCSNLSLIQIYKKILITRVDFRQKIQFYAIFKNSPLPKQIQNVSFSTFFAKTYYFLGKNTYLCVMITISYQRG